MFELNDINILEQIVDAHGVSGDEHRIRDLIETLTKPHVDQTWKDSSGNLIVLKKGIGSNKKKIMVTAHIDEIGMMVKHIDKGGFIRFATVGGIDSKTIVAQDFLILGHKGPVPGVLGSKAIHIQKEEERRAAVKIEDCFIDTGLTEDSVRDLVSIGDMIVRVSPVRKIGDCLCSKSMDNRVSVFVAMRVINALTDPYHDIYISFNTQEEVGLRGARVTTNFIKPDIGINIDISLANDTPGVPEQDQEAKMANGPGIKFMDATSICHRMLTAEIVSICKQKQIPYQAEVCNKGGTDTAAMQYMTGHGCIAGAISIPIRYAHSPVELVHQSDIVNASVLLHELLKHDFKNIF